MGQMRGLGSGRHILLGLRQDQRGLQASRMATLPLRNSTLGPAPSPEWGQLSLAKAAGIAPEWTDARLGQLCRGSCSRIGWLGRSSCVMPSCRPKAFRSLFREPQS